MASSINTILEELYSLQRLGIKVGLEHTVQLLDQIGNPHKKLRLIHVAGTNGKGLYHLYLQHGLVLIFYGGCLFDLIIGQYVLTLPLYLVFEDCITPLILYLC